jgi:hypothetical protein
MQSMNTDPQTYYTNPSGPHPAQAGYYISNGMDPQYSIRHPSTFQQRMPHTGYYNQQANNNFGQQTVYVPTPYAPAPFIHTNGPRALNPYAVPVSVPVIRPPNEAHNGTPTYISQTGYSMYPNNTMQQAQNTYNPQASYYPYPAQQAYTLPQQPSSSQISTQPQISQSQYTGPNTPAPPQSSPTSQQPLNDQQQGVTAPSSREKRQRKPIPIIDPQSHETVKVETPNSSANVSSTTTTDDDTRQKDSNTDSTIQNPKLTDEANQLQKRADFRKQFAEQLNPNAQTDKNANQSSTDDQIDTTSTKENIAQQSTSSSRSSSISRTKSPTPSSTDSTSNKSSEQPHPGLPGIPIRSITEDKSNQDDTKDNKQDQINSEKPPETVSINSKSSSDDTTNNEISSKEEITIKSQSTSSLSASESLECVTPPQSNNNESESPTIEKTPSISKRHSYTIQELLNKRSAPGAQRRPTGLKAIDGVTNPLVQRQSSAKNNQGSRGSNIQIDKPELHNRV